jgi:hypothetical protein
MAEDGSIKAHKSGAVFEWRSRATRLVQLMAAGWGIRVDRLYLIAKYYHFSRNALYSFDNSQSRAIRACL